MARSLGLERDSEGGNWVKYDGKSGRVTIPSVEGKGLVEVTGLRAVFDFENIKTGWVKFATGIAPHFIEDIALGHKSPKPGEKYKRGFRMNIFSNQQLGGVREMMGNSKVQTEAISSLFAQYDDAPESRQGLLPVVRLAAVTPVQSSTREGQVATNYAPVFVIDKWVTRPAELMAAPAAQATGEVADEFGELRVPASRMGMAPTSASITVLPPRPTVTPLAANIEDEFGPSPKPAGAV